MLYKLAQCRIGDLLQVSGDLFFESCIDQHEEGSPHFSFRHQGDAAAPCQGDAAALFAGQTAQLLTDANPHVRSAAAKGLGNMISSCGEEQCDSSGFWHVHS